MATIQVHDKDGKLKTFHDPVIQEKYEGDAVRNCPNYAGHMKGEKSAPSATAVVERAHQCVKINGEWYCA